MFDCVGVGRICVDLLSIYKKFPEIDSKIKSEEMLLEGGGQISTSLVALSRLGLKVKIIGRAGNDLVGKFAVERLKKEGVDIKDVIYHNEKSPLASIWIDKKTGKRTILYSSFTKKLKPLTIKDDIIKNTKIFMFDPQESHTLLKNINRIKKFGKKIIFDAERKQKGIEKIIKEVDYFVASSDFIKSYFGNLRIKEGILKLYEIGAKFVCVTMGEKGSIAYYNNRWIKVPIYRVKVKDTTGCGDTFHSGFTYGVIKGWSIEESMYFGSLISGFCAKGLGGRESLPDERKALKEFKKFYFSKK